MARNNETLVLSKHSQPVIMGERKYLQIDFLEVLVIRLGHIRITLQKNGCVTKSLNIQVTCRLRWRERIIAPFFHVKKIFGYIN
jgi:hypothetical protein